MASHLKLPRAQVLASTLYRKVVYPEVEKFTFNLCRGGAVEHAGLRHFNRNLSPAIRYHNDGIKYEVVYPLDRSLGTSTIDIAFKDGSSTTLVAKGKDCVDIFNELIIAAKGVSHITKRSIPQIALDTPTLLPNPKDN